MAEAKRSLIFVTGNAGKLKEVQRILGDYGIQVESQKVPDLPELQGEPDEITRDKCLRARKALAHMNATILIEDTSLGFDALGGLPGPYIKWFLDKLGHDGLNRLLMGYEDKSAKAQCIFGLMEPGSTEPLLFRGICPGKIVPPRGSKAFGWDCVFQPDGHEETFGEMSAELKNQISHRSRALQQLREYFGANKTTL